MEGGEEASLRGGEKGVELKTCPGVCTVPGSTRQMVKLGLFPPTSILRMRR